MTIDDYSIEIVYRNDHYYNHDSNHVYQRNPVQWCISGATLCPFIQTKWMKYSLDMQKMADYPEWRRSPTWVSWCQVSTRHKQNRKHVYIIVEWAYVGLLFISYKPSWLIKWAGTTQKRSNLLFGNPNSSRRRWTERERETAQQISFLMTIKRSPAVWIGKILTPLYRKKAWLQNHASG